MTSYHNSPAVDGARPYPAGLQLFYYLLRPSGMTPEQIHEVWVSVVMELAVVHFMAEMEELGRSGPEPLTDSHYTPTVSPHEVHDQVTDLPDPNPYVWALPTEREATHRDDNVIQGPSQPHEVAQHASDLIPDPSQPTIDGTSDLFYVPLAQDSANNEPQFYSTPPDGMVVFGQPSTRTANESSGVTSPEATLPQQPQTSSSAAHDPAPPEVLPAAPQQRPRSRRAPRAPPQPRVPQVNPYPQTPSTSPADQGGVALQTAPFNSLPPLGPPPKGIEVGTPQFEEIYARVQREAKGDENTPPSTSNKRKRQSAQSKSNKRRK